MSVKQLKKWSRSLNIAHDLSKEQLDRLRGRVLNGFLEDKNSMQTWLQDRKKVEELCMMKAEPKSTASLKKAANLKLPLIYRACDQYASNTYPLLFKDNKLVKYEIIGYDDLDENKKKQGIKTTTYMNYDLLTRDQLWEQEHDRLLFLNAMGGFNVKKIYHDPLKNKICARLVDYKKFIVNKDITSLQEAERISEVICMSLNTVMGYKNKKDSESGKSIFLEEPCEMLYEQHKLDDVTKDVEFIQMQLNEDLDEDGISEPYIVTSLMNEGTIFRVQPRYTEEGILSEGDDVLCIEPFDIYQDYHYLPNPDGSFLSVGIGVLLLHMNEAVNCIASELLNAGRLANMKAGVKDANAKIIGDGAIGLQMGQWLDIAVLPGQDVSKCLMPFQYGEPSQVLFQLLGYFIQQAEQISSSTPMATGNQSPENAKTGATLALLEKVKATHTAIQKRHYRSLSQEFQKRFRLYGMFLDKDSATYTEYAGGAVLVRAEDFDPKKIMVTPVADPNLSSDADKLQAAQVAQGMLQMPGVDPIKTTKFILQQLPIPGIETIEADANTKQPPNPDLLKIQTEHEHNILTHNEKDRELTLKEALAKVEGHRAEDDRKLKNAQVILTIAQAEALKQQTPLKKYEIDLDALNNIADREDSQKQRDTDLASQVMDQAHQAGMAGMQNQQDQQLQQNQQQHEQTMQQPDIAAQPDQSQEGPDDGTQGDQES